MRTMASSRRSAVALLGGTVASWCATSNALAADVVSAGVERQPINLIAIAMFSVFVGITLAIIWWAARQGTRSAKDYYAAGGDLKGFQNGLAIAGDYTSAATFLGVTALVFASGYDGLIYAIGFLVGFPVILFLIAEPLRNLGRYTFADVASYRLDERPIRAVAGSSALIIVIFYLIAQMVGAGKLIQLLFGLPYVAAVFLVGILMMVYVTFGGMRATTWVQIIKAVLLLGGSVVMALGILWRFGFSVEELFRTAIAAHPKGEAIMAPGGLIKDPISAVSLGLALIFGTGGLPHILMRFFTVADAKQARISVLVTTGFISIFYSLLFVLGFGAIAIVGTDPQYKDAAGAIIGGGNMVALHLADAIGGSLLLGFISAVAFATILAVVAGLSLAGASAVSHDLYASVLKRGRVGEAEEVRVSKLAAVGLGLVAIALGILFEKQNIAFMVGLVFAISASANFPILILSLTWKKLTTRGAVAGALAGLIGSISMVVLGPGVWTAVLGFATPIFPYDNPALFSVPLAFAAAWLVSTLDRSGAADHARLAFEGQYVNAQIGARAAAGAPLRLH